MNWTELLKAEIRSTYSATEGLLALVDDDKLAWKPSTGSNWMTIGQLLKHLTQCCGAPFRGFITRDWGIPEGMDVSKLTPEQHLPPAENLPAVQSVAEAKQLLQEDKRAAIELLAACGEKGLANRMTTAPWDPGEVRLGHRLLQMVDHLKQHKGQLFYYLKLQGKPVSTRDLWGM
jgi:uncharacterized damage-inducible protein DinB